MQTLVWEWSTKWEGDRGGSSPGYEDVGGCAVDGDNSMRDGRKVRIGDGRAVDGEVDVVVGRREGWLG